MLASVSIQLERRRVPQWMLRTIGVVSSLVGALAEMSYQWDIPYVMDDRAFRTTFGMEPTPLDEAIAATLAAHRQAAAAAA